MGVSFYALRPGEDDPLNLHDERKPSFNNGNALAVLRTMGLVGDESELWGGRLVDLPSFRRACMRGASELRARRNQRPASAENRVTTFGLDAGGILDRVRELAEWAEVVAEKGAAIVYWG
jgi:hypothetical protein